MTAGVTKTLAQFCANLKYEDIPPEVLKEGKQLLLDTLGCGLGGYEVEKGQMGVELTLQMGGTPEATIVGQKQKVPVSQAAFANGELMNALDWNAVMAPAHVPPYVLPPALALAELNRKSGKDLLTAFILGMEVSSRVGSSMGGMRANAGGFPMRVWGLSANSIGATAAAAHVLKLDDRKMLNALGLGGYYAPIPTHVKYNHTIEVGYAKYAPSGWMAQGGVVTAKLAEKGARGDTTFLEGDYGFWAMNGAPSCDYDKIVGGLGKHWSLMNFGYKYYPICGMFQSALDGFIAMIDEHKIQPNEIENVLVKNEAFAGLPKYVNDDPHDHVECASAMPYCIAVAAHRVKLGPKWQSKETMNDPGVRALMKKVKYEVNPRSEPMRHLDVVVEKRTYINRRPADLEIKARGKTFVGSVDYAQWMSMDAAYRPTWDGLAGKFHANAEIILSKKNADKVVDLVHDIEKLDDTSKLTAVLAD